MADPLGRFTRMEDLAVLSDQEIQALFKEIDQADAVVGLLEMSRETRLRFMANISRKAQELIEEDWNSMGKVSPEEGNRARKKILDIANSLRKK